MSDNDPLKFEAGEQVARGPKERQGALGALATRRGIDERGRLGGSSSAFELPPVLVVVVLLRAFHLILLEQSSEV